MSYSTKYKNHWSRLWQALAFSLIVGLAACDSPTDPMGGRRKGDTSRATICALAEDMMRNPGRYSPEFPSEAVRLGRDLWNSNNCSGGGNIRT